MGANATPFNYSQFIGTAEMVDRGYVEHLEGGEEGIQVKNKTET